MSNGVYKLSEVNINSDYIGGKARNLAILTQKGFPIPFGFVISVEAFEKGELKEKAIADIKELLEDEAFYAVRSSAMMEDSLNESWAGQFESFLNVKSTEVINKILECHNSKKERAISYANGVDSFSIAVIVQKMVKADYAGVAFSKNPITGKDEIVTEYVDGLGEDLVSGRKDPIQIVINDELEKEFVPFDIMKLKDYILRIVKAYHNVPQDIEYAVLDSDIYILQTRPVTTNVSNDNETIDLGEIDELFFWGPSKAEAKYMSDFFAGIELFFEMLSNDKKLPNPPKTLCLFSKHQMVWLNKASHFTDFCLKMFKYYEKNIDIDKDIEMCTDLKNKGNLVKAFYQTEWAEFALYGAETEIFKRLDRFDDEIKRKIIAAFATPEEETFLNRLDRELVELGDYKEMARKNSWICDGYGGVKGIKAAENYFLERTRLLNGEISPKIDFVQKRKEILEKYDLCKEELSALELLKKLIKYMDDRKEWMMRSRGTIKKNLSKIDYGWYYDGEKSRYLSEEQTNELYSRYVLFKSATGVLKGIVASYGNHHFVNGKVVVVSDSTQQIDNDVILVCPMTSPSYVPLMRKAKALITDHGGAMSHAAIVAREFGLPAIVGTKRATKVLKTGDYVMLNLLTGEIIK